MKQFESLIKKAETPDDLYGSVVSFNIERIESGQSPIWSFGNKRVLEQRERELIGTSTNYEMISETRQRICGEKLAATIKIYNDKQEGVPGQTEALLGQSGAVQVPPKELVDIMNFKGNERLRHYHLVHYLRTLLWATLVNRHPEKESQLLQEEYVGFPEMCFKQPKAEKPIDRVIRSAAPLILEAIPDSLMPKLPAIHEFIWRGRVDERPAFMTHGQRGKYSIPPVNVHLCWRNSSRDFEQRLDQFYDKDTKKEFMYTFFEILKITSKAAKILSGGAKDLKKTPLGLAPSHYALFMVMLRNYAINFTIHHYLESQRTKAPLSPLGRRMGIVSMIDPEKGLIITYPDAQGTLSKITLGKISQYLNSSAYLPMMHMHLFEVAEFCKTVCEESDSDGQSADV